MNKKTKGEERILKDNDEKKMVEDYQYNGFQLNHLEWKSKQANESWKKKKEMLTQRQWRNGIQQDNDMTLDQDEDCLLFNIEVHKYN